MKPVWRIVRHWRKSRSDSSAVSEILQGSYGSHRACFNARHNSFNGPGLKELHYPLNRYPILAGFLLGDLENLASSYPDTLMSRAPQEQ